MNIIAAAIIGYLARLDPVRAAADAARRHRRHPRVSAPAVSGPPTCCAPATRRSPRVTLVFDVGKGVAAVLIGALWGAEAALVASVAVGRRAHVPGMAALSRRQGGGHGARGAARAGLAGRGDRRRAVARDGGDLALFLAGGAGRRGRRPGARLACGRPAPRDRVRSSRSWSCSAIASNIQRLLAGTESRISFRKG